MRNRIALTPVNGLILFFLLACSELIAQSELDCPDVLNTCENIGFEQGTTEGWAGSYGSGGTLDECGLVDGRHTIMIDGSSGNGGFDPLITDTQIPVVAPGSQYSLRLGNDGTNYRVDQISTSFVVTEDNTLFSYQFAVVLEDPGHPPEEQPKFEVVAEDANGNRLPCGYYRVVSAPTIDGFENQGNLRYRDWSTVGIDLTPYVGQTVTIRFTTTDCAQGGHFGYAYIDAECLRSEINISCAGSEVCSEDAVYCEGSSITLSAPEGFSDYIWSDGSEGRQLFLPNPSPGASYSVSFNNDTQISIDTCPVSLSTTIPSPAPVPEPNIEGDTLVCPGAITALSVDAPYAAYSWSNGAGEESVTIPAGVHRVSVTNEEGCIGVDEIQVEEVELAQVEATIEPVTCFGGNDGSISVTASSMHRPLSFSWGDTLLNDLTAGNYNLTVTDEQGCSTMEAFVVNEPDLLRTDQFDFDSVSCFGQSDGSLIAQVSGGTPPYTYSWSTGSTSSIATGLLSGNYQLTVTDANGCQNSGNYFLPQPNELAGQLSQDRISCFGGSDGALNLAVQGGTPGYSINWSVPGYSDNYNVGSLAAGEYYVTVIDQQGCVYRDSARLEEPAPLEVTATADSVSCPGRSDGEATVIPSGGTPAYSFTWEAGVQPDSLAVGSYTVTVTDAEGCTETASVSVTEPPAVVLSLQQDSVSCYGGADGSAEVIASGGYPGYTYEWLPPANSNTTVATGLEAGTYTVEVADETNCRATGQITVYEPPELDASPFELDSVSCFGGNDGRLIARPAGGTSPLQVDWSNGVSGQQVVSNLSSGNYQVTVTDANGCTATSIYYLPQPSELTADLLQDSISCYGGADGSVNLVVDGGTPNYWTNWSVPGANGAFSLNGLSAGIYAVTVTDDNDCTASSTAEVLEPPLLTLNGAGDSTTCAGGQDGVATVIPQGGTPVYQYEWSGLTAVGNVADSLSAGTYTVTVTDVNGCEDDIAINIGQPTPLSIELQQDSVRCYGGDDGSAEVEVSGGVPDYTYRWLAPVNSNSPKAYNLSAGMYQVEIIDAYGCTRMDSIRVKQPAEIAAYTDEQTFPDCNQGQPGITTISPEGGTPPYDYFWSNGTFGDTLKSFEGGRYDLTIVDSRGCEGEASAEVLVFSIESSVSEVRQLGGANVICLADSALLAVETNSLPSSVQWSPSNLLSCDSCISTYAYPTGDSTYYVDVVDQFGCQLRDSIRILVDDDCGVYIPNAFSPNGDYVNDYFRIYDDGRIKAVTKMEIYHRWGGLVFRRGSNNSPPEIDSVWWDGTFDGEELNSNVYIYNIEVILVNGSKRSYKGQVHLIR
ncbi:MAG: T9SS type B sorting domain-containing protein [Bacteroidetes bacterium]|jgi:gliding motility-associated-like protein|nr:T9SS type B sorting domain-containing protein [Bacteroidota bacterium]